MNHCIQLILFYLLISQWGTRMKKYYSLIGKESKEALYTVLFGDYDRETIDGEKAEYVDCGVYFDLKIISTTDKQADIIAHVDHLNKQQKVVTISAILKEVAILNDELNQSCKVRAAFNLPSDGVVIVQKFKPSGVTMAQANMHLVYIRHNGEIVKTVSLVQFNRLMAEV